MIVLSLCDYTGEWCRPYREAGYIVEQIDVKLGRDVRLLDFPGQVHGILMAPPCTAFAGSGAQYWPAKDASGETFSGLALVDACLRLVAVCRPAWWALENPVGRLRRWLGPPRYIFDPCDHGDPYTKKTCLWGSFTIPKKTPVEPVRANAQGSWVQSLGGKSERTKTLRSVTPAGFARAFFEANP
jgi:hypothetical protein